MIDVYNFANVIDDVRLKSMYDILIENLFKLHPSFKEERDKYDNNDIYNKWKSMVINTKDYSVILYEDKNVIYGFLNYCVIDCKLWISEVQVKKEYQNKGILKKLVTKFINLDDVKKHDLITIHINSNNILSQTVFSHIGFKNIGNTLYEINYNTLLNWVNKS